MSTELLLKIYLTVKKPLRYKYPPSRKVYNVNLYG